ncbi:MAG: Oxidoreductase, short-chain dehydrogenase/reductase family [uncultured Segetibacter sp.]|uniref:Oxidoreductase, short-chain dehydrogenase/reductase family n=1 Tax=uncultured Segetibacter sp. TaxID=481133 RepID=A0A6J4RH65_9BACT|nr:MAG: Oxidoreductase, short-chain dehydrogenase/reductase family [uncultured Segetibacter sp.]
MRLRNKVIIITGSTTGIGKAIALHCAAEGAFIVVNGLEEEWGKTVAEQIGKDKATLHIEDISEEGAPQRLVDVAIKTFGKLDAIVNNAAAVVSSDIQTTDKAFLRKVLDINTIAPFLLIKAALPYLAEQAGSVLNIGSVNGWCGEPNLLAYSISKGALMTMTRNLGDTLHRENGVRVNQINPGWVLTENEVQRKKEQGLEEDWFKDIPELFAPARRILQPEEIAAAALYWLSDESGPVSGQVMELEQYPLIGRNPPKDTFAIKISK